MRYKTVKDILDWTVEFHQQLGKLAGAAADDQQQERLKMLLDYLADHEAELRNAVQNIEDDVPDRLLATWFDRSPEIELPTLPEETDEAADAAYVDKMVGKVVDFHDHMVSVYTNLSEQTNNEQIGKIFTNLAELEEHEKINLVRGAQQMRDL